MEQRAAGTAQEATPDGFFPQALVRRSMHIGTVEKSALIKSVTKPLLASFRLNFHPSDLVKQLA